MKKTKNKPTSNIRPILLYGVIGLLCVVCVLLLVQHKNTSPSPQVSLGAMQYRFLNGTSLKRRDASVKSLKAFLEYQAANEGCPSSEAAYEHVVAYTQDESQVLLKYGCNAATYPVFATKTNGTWSTLSPTNQFDDFDIPLCSYVTDHNISNEIAPVCANGTSAELTGYVVR